MKVNSYVIVMLALAVLGITGCASPSLYLASDPAGADVSDARLGYLGQTPLTRKFSRKEWKKWMSPSYTLNLEISKKGYVDEKMGVVLIPHKEIRLKRNLFERFEYIDITSEPDGVAVFLEFIDSDAYRKATPAMREKMRFENKHDITKRFLGNTPIRYHDNPSDPLENGDFLTLKKAGYKDSEALFRDKEKRLHIVMDPLHSMER